MRRCAVRGYLVEAVGSNAVDVLADVAAAANGAGRVDQLFRWVLIRNGRVCGGAGATSVEARWSCSSPRSRRAAAVRAMKMVLSSAGPGHEPRQGRGAVRTALGGARRGRVRT